MCSFSWEGVVSAFETLRLDPSQVKSRDISDVFKDLSSAGPWELWLGCLLQSRRADSTLLFHLLYGEMMSYFLLGKKVAQPVDNHQIFWERFCGRKATGYRYITEPL